MVLSHGGRIFMNRNLMRLFGPLILFILFAVWMTYFVNSTLDQISAKQTSVKVKPVGK